MQFGADGSFSKSQVAVLVQEDITLPYGPDNSHQKQYHVCQCIFHSSPTSNAGHFTLAAREQQGGMFSSDDTWRYLDSEQPVRRLTLTQMLYRYSQDLYAVLLVAKTQPQDDLGPLLQAPLTAKYGTVLIFVAAAAVVHVIRQ